MVLVVLRLYKKSRMVLLVAVWGLRFALAVGNLGLQLTLLGGKWGSLV